MDQKKDKHLDMIVRNHVFYGNNLLYFIYKKCLKISKAIYLVTDIIKDTEPLKWSLRQTAAESIVIKDNGNIQKIGQNISSCINNIRSLCILASFSGNISEMNCGILLRECDDLLISIAELGTFANQHLSLQAEFFNVSQLQAPSPFLSIMNQEKADSQFDHKGHIKDTETSMSFRNSSLDNKNTSEGPKSNFSTIKDTTKQNRTDQILAIIKEKIEVTIKDISSVINDCGEKTIQRELINLLRQGKIKKTGERRWSRYSLK